MNINIFLTVLASLVLVGGGVWYGVVQNNNQEMETAVEANKVSEINETDLSETELVGTGPFTRFLNSEMEVRCDFSSEIDDISSSGVFYTDGTRFRVDATSDTSFGRVNSNVINDSEFQYVWSNGAFGTVAMKMVSTKLDNADSKTDDTTAFDIEQDVTYACRPWTVDEAMFVPPSDINFTDINTVMQKQIQGMPSDFTIPSGY